MGNRNNNKTIHVISLPYILIRQTILLRCMHLLMIYHNQLNLMQNHSLKLKKKMTEEVNTLLNVVTASPSSYQNDTNHKSVIIGGNKDQRQWTNEDYCSKNMEILPLIKQQDDFL